MSAPSIVRPRTRARVIALEKASQTIGAAYGHSPLAMMKGPSVRIGDVIRLPVGHAGADLRLNLWDLTCLLEECQEKLEEELRREEAIT